jgi:hypothetical protein
MHTQLAARATRRTPTILSALLLVAAVAPLRAAADGGPDSVPAIRSMEAFRELAEETEGDLYMKFLIDRTQKTIHYVNGRRFTFHYDFARTLHPNLSPEMFNDLTYFTANRRFIAGTIGYHTSLKRCTFQYWEGDRANETHLRLTLARLQETFLTREIAYKPNSPAQEELARKVPEIPVLTSDEIYANMTFRVYNPGAAVGRLRILRAAEKPEDVFFDRGEVVLLDLIPSDITPVAGIIATKFSTPLSHMNLRAYAWKIPNMVLKDAIQQFAHLEGQKVFYRCDPRRFEVRPATRSEIEEYERTHRPPRPIKLTWDSRYRDMPDLGTMAKKDADRIGSKAANLSELVRQGGLNVPRGFAVPFAYYEDFVRANKLSGKIRSILRESRFKEDPVHRRAQLAAIRAMIVAGRHTESFRKAFLDKVHREYPGVGVFVRSSTNSEDLKGFNGAGLYDSVPNVKGDENLLDAVKTVWASIFNFKAYQERSHYGIDHLTVQPAVAVVATVDAAGAGVLVTTDIYDANFPESFTINAKKGLGISVVDGKSIPEQVIYDPLYDSIKVMSRSEDATELVIGPDGGVIERPVANRDPVLSPDDVRKLCAAAQRVRDVFRAEGVQDIEWVITGASPASERKAWVVQSRPYLGGGTATPTATPGLAAPAPMDGVAPKGERY